jgi:hypothetical protein
MFAKAKIFAKTFAKTKIFAKRNFAKIISFSHDFRFSRKWKKPFSFQPYFQLSRGFNKQNLIFKGSQELKSRTEKFTR